MDLVKAAFRSQTIFSGFLLVLSVAAWPYIIGQLKDYESKDRLQFNCMPEVIKFKTQLCYNNYTSAMSPLLTPLNFAGITFGLSGCGWLLVTLLGALNLRRIHKERDEETKKKLEKLFLRKFIFHICGQFVLLVVMIGLFLHYQKFKYPEEPIVAFQQIQRSHAATYDTKRNQTSTLLLLWSFQYPLYSV